MKRTGMLPLLLVSMFASILSGCDDGSPGCEAGTLACACYPNGTCNAGLGCVDGVCASSPSGFDDGGASTRDGGASTLDGALSDAAPVPTGPLSLTISNVQSLERQDCIEPRYETGTRFDTDATEGYLTAANPTPPPGVTIVGADGCSWTGTELECPFGTLDSINLPSAGVLRMRVSNLRVSCGTCSGVWDVRGSEEVVLAVQGASPRVNLRQIDTLDGSVMTISDMRFGALELDPELPTIGTNERVIIPPSPNDELRAFHVPTDGSYVVAPLCYEDGSSPSCDAFHSSCQILDRTLNVVATDLAPEIGPMENPPPVDETCMGLPGLPGGSCVPLGRPTTLAAGEYFVMCDGTSVDVSVRTYDDEFVAACSVLHWYFQVRRGQVPVTDLEREQLRATVDGRDLGVESAATLGHNPAVMNLLLDRSFSITEAGARDAVVDAVDEFARSMPDGTMFRLYQFASEPDVPLPIWVPLPGGRQTGYTSRPERLIDGLNQEAIAPRLPGTPPASYEPWPVATSESFTKLFDATAATAFAAGTDRLTPVGAEQVIVVFTDGQDTASTVVVDGSGQPDVDELRSRLHACGTGVTAVGLGDDVRASTLTTISDGAYYPASEASELGTAFAGAAADISSRYRLRMLTPEPVEITSESTLTVTVDGDEETAVYTPPAGECVGL